MIENPLSADEVRRRYDEAMRFGSEQYLDVLAAFQRTGLQAAFVQTGGMNAALEVYVSDAELIRLTDEEDSLSWHRSDHAGWTIGRYLVTPDGEEELQDLRQFEDGSPEAALQSVQEMLGQPEADGQTLNPQF